MTLGELAALLVPLYAIGAFVFVVYDDYARGRLLAKGDYVSVGVTYLLAVWGGRSPCSLRACLLWSGAVSAMTLAPWCLTFSRVGGRLSAIRKDAGAGGQEKNGVFDSRVYAPLRLRLDITPELITFGVSIAAQPVHVNTFDFATYTGTAVLHRCLDCGALKTKTIKGTWTLAEVRGNVSYAASSSEPGLSRTGGR